MSISLIASATAKTFRRTLIELGTGEIPRENVNQRMEAAAKVVVARISREKASIPNQGAGKMMALATATLVSAIRGLPRLWICESSSV